MTTVGGAGSDRQPRFIYLILVSGIILLASFVRLSWLGIVEFKYDEAMISRRALDFIESGNWPASTISSIPGIPQPPYKALLLAIPYFVSRNPIVAATFQSLLGVMTVAVTAKLADRYFGSVAGIFSAILLAAAPWAFFYDRKLWSQNVPIFTILLIFALFRVVVERKPRWIVGSCVALGFLIGFYLGNAILAGVVGLSLALTLFLPQPAIRKSRSSILIWSAIGLFALAIVMYPFVRELILQRDSLKLNSLPGTPEAQSGLWDHVLMAATVGTGSQFHSLAGDQASRFQNFVPAMTWGSVIDTFGVWVTVCGMVYVIIRAVMGITANSDKHKTGQKYAVLGLWIIVPVAAWAFLQKTAFPHRYIMMIPAQCISAGVLLADTSGMLLRSSGRWRRLILIATSALFITVSAWHVVLISSMMNFVSGNLIVGGHGTPASRLWTLVDMVYLSGEPDLPVVVYADSDNPEYEGSAAVIDALLGDRSLYIVANSELSVYPVENSIQIMWHNGEAPQVARQAGVSTSMVAGIARLENGIDLVSVTTEMHSGSVQVILNFRVWAHPSSSETFGYSIQFLDENQQPLSKSDSPFLRVEYWRIGDTVLIRHPVSQPVNKVRFVMFSMYSYMSTDQITGVNILDIAGNPAGQQVIVPIESLIAQN